MSLRRCVGLLRESYSKWERRAPLCPSHVRELVNDGISVVVQPSKSRVFSDKEFEDAGACIRNDLSECSVILGVKQVPVADLLPDKTYMFFSHTIKGQQENMPLLDECLQKNVRLVDYECITKGEPAHKSRAQPLQILRPFRILTQSSLAMQGASQMASASSHSGRGREKLA